MNYDEKMALVYSLLIDYEKENEEQRDISNKGEKWTDEELKIILTSAPTKENCIKYAKLFKRGYGSIEQIYRWAVTPKKNMSEERKADSFVQQVKKIAKEVGLRGQKRNSEKRKIRLENENQPDIKSMFMYEVNLEAYKNVCMSYNIAVDKVH